MNTPTRFFCNGGSKLLNNLVLSSHSKRFITNNKRFINNASSYIDNYNKSNNKLFINENRNNQFKHQKRYKRDEDYFNYLPKDGGKSESERSVFALLGIGAICLLGYVLYDSLEDMIIENIMYNQTIAELRANKSIIKLFKEDFSAHGLGLRSQFSIRRSIQDPSIYHVYYNIKGYRDLVGHVAGKLKRVSMFGFETEMLRVVYGEGKVVYVISEDKKFVKTVSNKVKKMFSSIVPKSSPSNDGDTNYTPNKPKPDEPKTPQEPNLGTKISQYYDDFSNYISKETQDLTTKISEFTNDITKNTSNDINNKQEEKPQSIFSSISKYFGLSSDPPKDK
ncbi:hypothetical protein DICPUDRAFT_151815 [Dictyostelium purpureum]|uniref:Mitochondrial import inner membrane translocase subunit Tim21 n=1 Tax=Dictyostelium purpureum TaxID=5786 RepID=F0ZJT7_DICPU|nr:uncharacterized protein DICPUDRAFT_151815 [Dictyostelium purpureum]EGC35797.1 hypothetical protein DICPUDRAFT_151815 [Dictyostelium purpureum]|eukprot:XP_003287691.1 hypothetical protein DICPUDRAFT_151815 [Dictyostelium purpureum]